jgi:hypothetical protein
VLPFNIAFHITTGGMIFTGATANAFNPTPPDEQVFAEHQINV